LRGGYVQRHRGSNAYDNRRRALQNHQNWEKRQRRLQSIKDKLSDIKESIKTGAIKSKYKALRFANDVGENLRDKYFYMLDIVDLLSAKPPDSTEELPNSSDKELDEVVKIENDLKEIEKESNVSYNGEEISYDALEFQKRQANELLTSTNDSREIVYTPKVEIEINNYTEYIGEEKGEGKTFDTIVVKIVGETLVYPAINLLTDTYKIGDANRGSKPEQLLKIIGAVINNNDIKNGKLSGNPIPIPQLLYGNNVEAYTPVKISQTRDNGGHDTWDIWFIKSGDVEKFKNNVAKGISPYEGVSIEQYRVDVYQDQGGVWIDIENKSRDATTREPVVENYELGGQIV